MTSGIICQMVSKQENSPINEGRKEATTKAIVPEDASKSARYGGILGNLRDRI
jgi:hypothetical protein